VGAAPGLAEGSRHSPGKIRPLVCPLWNANDPRHSKIKIEAHTHSDSCRMRRCITVQETNLEPIGLIINCNEFLYLQLKTPKDRRYSITQVAHPIYNTHKLLTSNSNKHAVGYGRVYLGIGRHRAFDRCSLLRPCFATRLCRVARVCNRETKSKQRSISFSITFAQESTTQEVCRRVHNCCSWHNS
jgi:hypothetical protein